MKKFVLVLSVVLSVFLMTPWVASAENNYALWCRGPLSILGSASYSAQFAFAKHTGAAGANGENLAPGTCAWADRGIGASEPSELSYPELNLNSVTDFQGVGTQLSVFQRDLMLLTHGLTTDKYKVKVLVHSSGPSFVAPVNPVFRQITLVPVK